MVVTVEHLTDELAMHWHSNGATTIRIGSGGSGQAITLTSDESRLVAEHITERATSESASLKNGHH